MTWNNLATAPVRSRCRREVGLKALATVRTRPDTTQHRDWMRHGMEQRMRLIRTAALAGVLCLTALTWVSAAIDAPIADAAMRQDADAVRSLLTAGADVNAPQGDGMTGLHWAARYGATEIVRLLLNAGADHGVTTRLGDHTALHVASRAGQASSVLALLNAGAVVNALTTTGTTPLHFAATAGNVDTLTALLDHGAHANAREPVWGQTPLMFAAAADRGGALAALLARGADPGVTGTVVDIAARNKTDQADSRRRRERMAALREGREPDVNEAPSASAIAEPTPAPHTPEHPEPPSAESRAAARAAEATAYEADLQEEPEPLGFADLVGTHGGLTALLLAARDGHTDAARTLVDGGADINQVSAADATSPLLIAAINGHFDLAMLFLEMGADPSLSSDAGATPLYGALNMQWAPKARHPQPTDYLQQSASYMELMDALLAAGADVNARLTKSLWFTTYNRDLLGVDRAGATPFWRAAYALDIDAMRMLLAHGADPHLPTRVVPSRRRPLDPDPSGLPPMELGGAAVSPVLAASGVGYGQGYAGNTHRHVPDGWLQAVRFLVEEVSADMHYRDHNGYNAIHHAAARGDNELILYLVEHGVDVTQVSRRGQTTVDMANGPVQRIQPFPETIAILERLGAQNNHSCLSC